MIKFAKNVQNILFTQSLHLYVEGESNLGKSCWVLSLFENLYNRSEFEYDFCPSLLRGLYTTNLKALLIDESGSGFNSRKWNQNISEVFQWTRIFKRLIVLCTTHRDNQDVQIRDRTSFKRVTMIRKRVAVVEGIGIVVASDVSKELLEEFQMYEYNRKLQLTRELVENFIEKNKVVPKI